MTHDSFITYESWLAAWLSSSHCNTLVRTSCGHTPSSRTATHCNTLQHTATNCNTHDFLLHSVASGVATEWRRSRFAVHESWLSTPLSPLANDSWVICEWSCHWVKISRFAVHDSWVICEWSCHRVSTPLAESRAMSHVQQIEKFPDSRILKQKTFPQLAGCMPIHEEGTDIMNNMCKKQQILRISSLL